MRCSTCGRAIGRLSRYCLFCGKPGLVFNLPRKRERAAKSATDLFLESTREVATMAFDFATAAVPTTVLDRNLIDFAKAAGNTRAAFHRLRNLYEE